MREQEPSLVQGLWDLPFPMVAALNGVAAGGGINLLLASTSSSRPSTPVWGRRSSGSG